MLRCPYHHPKWCTVMGHKDCRSGKCMMKGKPREILKAAKSDIEKDFVFEQTKLDSEQSSKYY